MWLLRKSEVAQMAKESILTKEEALALCVLCWEGDGYLEGPLPLRREQPDVDVGGGGSFVQIPFTWSAV